MSAAVVAPSRSFAAWSARAFAALLVVGLAVAALPAAAQQPPPPPPPPQPLGDPPVPAGNPLTTAKINLGKTLFWDEQLSVTNTVACGTCHRAFAGGSDARSIVAGGASTNPGLDGQTGTADDVHGSMGVPSHGADGLYQSVASFGFRPQVGGRYASSAVNAGYSPLLFWDGRAGTTFVDPTTGATLIANGGALENQALGPVVNTAEMSSNGATVADVAARLSGRLPLALAESVPSALSTWIAGRDYPALFAEAFGSSEVTPARIALAIASYERTLNANQTPFDAQNGGTPSLTTLEQQGLGVFTGPGGCAACHGGALTTDNQFHYTGVRPVAEDLGRFNVTGNNADRGAMKTPSLRNGQLRTAFMHDGRFTTLAQVVDFYDRGGDFTAPNKDPRIHPLNLSAAQKQALVAFLSRPLTDPRAQAETAPFDRPLLYTETGHVPTIGGVGQAGSGGATPAIYAYEPPKLGNRNFTVAIDGARGGATATLIVSRADPGLAASLPTADFTSASITLAGSGDGAGNGSVNIDLGDDAALVGVTLYGRWYVDDPNAPNGLAITPVFAATIYGTSTSVFRDGFE